MKIRLLRDHSYCGMTGISFPVEVEAKMCNDLYWVHERELERIGCDMDLFEDEDDPYWPFCEIDVEVIHES